MTGLIFGLLAMYFALPYNDYKKEAPPNEMSEVQPLTGIVFWWTNELVDTDAIALEFSYLGFNQIVKKDSTYDWTIIDNRLDEVASRNHQAIFRFRYTYVDDYEGDVIQTTVPDHIKNSLGYEETYKNIEGQKIYFPDWSSKQLEQFTLDFFKKFADRYDDDKRLAYLQVGFGLWGEYHLYNVTTNKHEEDLGVNFPSIAFQRGFFDHLDTVFNELHWSISIDAGEEVKISPFRDHPYLLDIDFGLFDDSFMSREHKVYNEERWKFFGKERYKRSPAGGEFTQYEGENEKVLSENGVNGESFESFSDRFHISYMIGDNQIGHFKRKWFESRNTYRGRIEQVIKQAGLHCGYKFKVTEVSKSGGQTRIKVKNIGNAPIYYDAFVAINELRSEESLKTLMPGMDRVYTIHTLEDGEISIECDRILDSQKITIVK